MKTTISVAFFVLILGLLAGCAANYYGYSKQEWEAMNRGEQLLAKEGYKKLLQEKYQLEHGNPTDVATDAFKQRAKGTSITN